MKKLTFLLFALLAASFAMQVNAQDEEKPKMRSAIYSSLPSGFQQVDETSLYYNISERYAVGPGYVYGISILGAITEDDGSVRYYSSTYESYGEGAGFVGAFKVNDNSAVYLNARTGTTSNGVTMTARIEGQGDVAARIIYSLTNSNSEAVTVSAGVWGDIMIGNNDAAPLSCLRNDNDVTYGIKMKYNNTENSPLLCALFGRGITGVEPADAYWFGQYRTNYTANAICGNYSEGAYPEYYMVENGSYDSGLGFCWKDRTIEPGETIELSYLISVGEIEFDPIIDPDEPGQDIFTYQLIVDNFDGWNDLDAPHPAHIIGHYEHPYGQEGFIEYRVDGTRGEWTRLEGLVSGEDYTRDFYMMFDKNITDIHTLDLRFTLGQGNYTDLNGREWEDVRSIDLAVDHESLVYNGEPQTFVVTVGGVIDYDVQYTNAGDYSFSIYGDYDMETIGINTVDFSIEKADPQITVTIPEDTEFDNQPHGATAVVNFGEATPVITYVDVNGNVLTEAPTAIGVYQVYVMVPESDNFNGLPNEMYGEFEIYDPNPTAVEELIIDTQDKGAWYTVDGRRVTAPTERGLYIHNGKKYIVK